MSLAEEMLATMSVSDDSVSYLADEEGHIVINESRQAIVPAELKTIAVTGDKDIETVTFDCVRYWDGNDLSTFAIYLNYVLPDMTTGTYIPESIVAEDDVYHFDWKIKSNITQKSGKISFAITAIKTKQNESGQTVVDKQWSSVPNGDCSIVLGLDISNVPSEEESVGVVAQLTAILENIHSNVDEWIKTVVVQSKGTSQTQVMSQNAVTVALDLCETESKKYTDSTSRQLDWKISRNSDIISRNSKRITNLEKGIVPEPFETDDSVAYTKDVPENALPFAEIQKVGGMTVKDETTGTLKSAPVTEVVSVGANLFDQDAWLVQQGAIPQSDGSYKCKAINKKCFVNERRISGSVFVSVDYKTDATNNPLVFMVVYTDGSNKYLGGATQTTSFKKMSFASDPTRTVDYIMWTFGNMADYYAKNAMISFVDMDYVPYKEPNTLPIPEAVQALDGYGDGVNESLYNYIDWENKRFVKRVGKVDLGTLGWRDLGSNNTYYVSITNMKLASSYEDRKNGWLCGKYEASTNVSMSTMDDKSALRSDVESAFYLRDSAYTDVASFKAAMSGVMLVYELATPEVTDLITADNLIAVEPNGTLTFENEHKYDVPSTVVYQLKGASV